jgi:hypothetical protein
LTRHTSNLTPPSPIGFVRYDTSVGNWLCSALSLARAWVAALSEAWRWVCSDIGDWLCFADSAASPDRSACSTLFPKYPIPPQVWLCFTHSALTPQSAIPGPPALKLALFVGIVTARAVLLDTSHFKPDTSFPDWLCSPRCVSNHVAQPPSAGSTPGGGGAT